MTFIDYLLIYTITYIALRLMGMYRGILETVTAEDDNEITDEQVNQSSTSLERATLFMLFLFPFVIELMFFATKRR